MYTLLIIIYLVGCILAYGSYYAGTWQIDKKYIRYLPPSSNDSWIIIFSLLSWLGFLASVSTNIFQNYTDYFLKFSNKDLWEEYYKYNSIK